MIPEIRPSSPPQENRASHAEWKAVSKNATWLVVSFAILAITQFATLGLMSRFGGVELVGVFVFVMAFRDPFLAFMDFGTTRLLVAEIARRPDESDQLLGNGLTLGLIIGVPVLGVMILVANLGFLALPELVKQAIYLTGIGALVFTTATSLRSAFRAFNRLQYEVVISAVLMTLGVGGTFIVLFFGLPFIWIFVALAASRLAALLVSWWIYERNLGRARLLFERPILKQLFNKTWAFSFVGLLSRAFMRIDVLILGLFHGAAAAGFYGLATTVFYQLNTLAQLLTTAILPSMASAYAKTRSRVGVQLDVTVRAQIVVGLPCTVIGIILAPQIIRLLYGPGYEATALIFQLLVSVVMIRFLNQTFGVVQTAIDEQGRRAWILGVTVGFNILGNLILIPRWSVLGATVVAIVSELLLYSLSYLYLPPDIRGEIHWRWLIRPFAAGLVSIPVLLLISDWPIFISIPLVLIVYAAMLFLFRSFSQDETRALIQLLEDIQPVPAALQRWLANFMLRFARSQAGAH